MATEPKAATEDVKIDLFEDDDEFEEFEINEGKSILVILLSLDFPRKSRLPCFSYYFCFWNVCIWNHLSDVVLIHWNSSNSMLHKCHLLVSLLLRKTEDAME